MSKFKQTLRVIEEGLLKPMSAADIEEVEAEPVKEVVDDILSRSTKNADGSIDVDRDVDLSGLNLKKLPLKFNKVNGSFYCNSNKLTTLNGSPKDVLNFYCSSNLLTSLEGGPEKVSGVFNASFNKLTSLEGVPKEVGEFFSCFNNKVNFTKEQVEAVCKVYGKIHV